MWFITPGLYDVVFAWHSVHAAVVGMWFAGFPVTPLLNEVVDVWQDEQSPVVG